MITNRITLNGVSWKQVSSFITDDSTVSEISGNNVIIVRSLTKPPRKLSDGHPFKRNQYILKTPLLATLWIRSVRNKATLVVTPGVDLQY